MNRTDIGVNVLGQLLDMMSKGGDDPQAVLLAEHQERRDLERWARTLEMLLAPHLTEQLTEHRLGHNNAVEGCVFCQQLRGVTDPFAVRPAH